MTMFEHDGMFVQSFGGTMESQDGHISGSLRVFEKDGDIIVDWTLLDDNFDSTNIPCAGKDSSSVVEWTQTPKERTLHGTEHQNSYEAEWDMVSTVSFKKRPFSNGDSPSQEPSQSKSSFRFSLVCLKFIKLIKDDISCTYVFCLTNDALLPALQFHQDIAMQLFNCLKTYAILCRSEEDSRIFHVQCLNKSPSRVFENLLDEPSFGLIQKLKKDPYTATMVGFSKVTNYIFDTLRGPDPLAQQRPPQEMADFLSDTIPHLKMNQQEEPGFEMITQIDVGQRMNVQRREPVSQAEWADSMDAEGRIVNIEQMKQALFKGGVCHALRKEVWKFLLNYFPWDSTKKERLKIHETKTDEYFRMKLQWKSVSAEQEERNSRLRDCRSLIEKDVNRTDRTNKFYEGQDNPSLIMLHDILMTYFMYDFDLGYIQGMSDLLSPILYVMENEVDAFWCFVSYMEQMHQNFEEQMQGLKLQLIQLSTLLRLLDSGFCSYLESQDSGYLYFCFRWLLIRFKREFSFNDILRLWEKQDVASADLKATIIFFNISLLRVTIRSNYESFDYKWKHSENYPFMPTVSSPWASMVMWTGLPCKNFHLIICCAILESEKPLIMDQQYGFNEILKHINELSMKLDVNDVLSKAEAICLQMMKCKELPQAVCEVLGLNSSNNTTKEMEMSGKENISQKTSQNSVQQDVLVSPHSASGKSSNRTTNSTSFTK